MPPSVNQCYATVGRKRVSSQALKKFKASAMMWAVLNRPHLVEVREEIEHNLLGAKVHLKFIFRFPSKRLYVKKSNTPKKLDVSNRIKPAEDTVCDFLGFDDRHVFKVEAQKAEGAVEDFDCYVYIYN